MLDILILTVLFVVVEWQLSQHLTLEVKEGKYGRFIVLTQLPRSVERKVHFLTLSPNPWRRFRSSVQLLNEVGHKVELTKEKKFVEVTMFKDNIYRSFSVKSDKGTAYINVNESEWTALLNMLPDLDKLIFPGPTTPCKTCRSEMKFIKLYSGRREKTTLSDEEMKRVESYNSTVENQLGILCDYCGIQCDFDCHCHKINCRQCSPDCFCNYCGSCLYYYYE